MIKLKKTLSWLKHYWYFPVVLIAIVIAFVVNRKKVELLAGVLVNSVESHKKQVEAIEKIEAEKSEKIEKAAIIHSEDLQKIIEEETRALETAEEAKEERQKSLQELEMEMLADAMKNAFKKEG
jgi:tetrahydromethanopterin S-methyltransferase subunit A